MAKIEIKHERLTSLLRYEPVTGAFRWLATRSTSLNPLVIGADIQRVAEAA